MMVLKYEKYRPYNEIERTLITNSVKVTQNRRIFQTLVVYVAMPLRVVDFYHRYDRIHMYFWSKYLQVHTLNKIKHFFKYNFVDEKYLLIDKIV